MGGAGRAPGRRQQGNGVDEIDVEWKQENRTVALMRSLMEWPLTEDQQEIDAHPSKEARCLPAGMAGCRAVPRQDRRPTNKGRRATNKEHTLGDAGEM